MSELFPIGAAFRTTGSQDPGDVTGRRRITEPFEAVIDLEQLNELA
jgi:hypothetical protein